MTDFEDTLSEARGGCPDISYEEWIETTKKHARLQVAVLTNKAQGLMVEAGESLDNLAAIGHLTEEQLRGLYEIQRHMAAAHDAIIEVFRDDREFARDTTGGGDFSDFLDRFLSENGLVA